MDVSSFSRRWCSWCYGDFTRVFWRGTWGTQEVQVGWNLCASWTLRRQLVLKIEECRGWKSNFIVSTSFFWRLSNQAFVYDTLYFCVNLSRINQSSYLSLQFKCIIVRIFMCIFYHVQSGQLPVGLIAQLVEYCTSIAEVMGSNLVQAWIFLSVFDFHNCLSCVCYNCADQSSFHIFPIVAWGSTEATKASSRN